MEWQGDEARLQQLCQMFAAASSPEAHVQQQVVQMLNQFSQLPDFNMYLVSIFAKRPDQQEVVRQRAGLLLKTNVTKMQAGSLPPGVSEHIQGQTLSAMQDSSRVIRQTAGTILTSLVQALGFTACGTALERLLASLSSPNAEVLEGSLSALGKICEDTTAHLALFADAPTEETRVLMEWCTQRVLPRVFECAGAQTPAIARLSAVECLGHFALNGVFDHQNYPTLRAYGEKYIEVLGIMASETSAEAAQTVCKGFATAVEHGWSCLTEQHYQAILRFMLQASQHPDYNVRWEALAVWAPCAGAPQSWNAVQPLLGELVPVLLANMVYSQADYMCMEQSQLEDDNAGVADSLDDVAPRFHKEQKNIDGDDDDDKKQAGVWGAEWTARKAAAYSLDTLTNVFQGDIIQVVLPHIERKLQHASWEHQEAGVLALGAIAQGAMEPLVQFLPKVMEMLLGLCKAPKPLVRSISSWCISRYSTWVCHPNNTCREQVLGSVLQALLACCHDRNKRVQEAACSAVAVLEEAALVQLAPFLDGMVQTFVRAFQTYQAKNLRILYDAVGTLAWAVGQELDRPQYLGNLMQAIMAKFERTPDNDITTIALFECASNIIQNLGRSIPQTIPTFVQRSMRIVHETSQAARMWEQNPNEFERPDFDLMAASVDLLTGVLEGLGEASSQVIEKQNFLAVLPATLTASAPRVRQSGFALLGTSATACPQALGPMLPELLPLCARGLAPGAPPAVGNNAAWSIGEVSVKAGPEFMAPYIDVVVPALVDVLQRQEAVSRQPWAQQQGHRQLLQCVCITLGRLGLICGDKMGQHLPSFLAPWCVIIRNTRLDREKINAFQGLVNMIRANSQAGMACVPQLTMALASLCPVNPNMPHCPCPPQLEQALREILQGYRQALGAQWPIMYNQIPEFTRRQLQQMYQVGA